MKKAELEKEYKKQLEIISFLENKIYKIRKYVDRHLDLVREGLAEPEDEKNKNAFNILVRFAEFFNKEIATKTMRCGFAIDIPVKTFKVNFSEENNQ